jgi:hypothetical protein
MTAKSGAQALGPADCEQGHDCGVIAYGNRNSIMRAIEAPFGAECVQRSTPTDAAAVSATSW